MSTSRRVRRGRRQSGSAEIPSLPATLSPLSAADLLADEEHDGIELVDADLSGEHLTALSLEEARLKSCRFDGAELRRLHCRQTVFENCDFANSHWLDCELAEVAFIDCRFTGASIAGGRLGQLLVRDCRLRLVKLSHLSRPSGVFERCDFGGALLMESDLSDLDFTGCDFRDAELFNVDLGGSDLRGNELDGLRGVGCLRGATIDGLQLLGLGPALAAHVGLVVDEEPGATRR